MADWAASGGNEGLLAGYTFAATPSNTAHVKGAWSAGYLNTRERAGCYLVFSWAQAHGTPRTLLFDLAVDGVVIAENLAINPGQSTANVRAHTQAIYLPLRIPAGSVQLRVQSSYAPHGIVYVVAAFPERILEPVGTARLHTLGANTSTTNGTVVTAHNTSGTFGAWSEISASVSQRLRGLGLWCGHGNAALTSYTSGQWYGVQVGIGAAGSETVLLDFLESGGASSSTGLCHPQWHPFFPVDIPVGARIAVRSTCEWTGSSQRSRAVILYGAE